MSEKKKKKKGPPAAPIVLPDEPASGPPPIVAREGQLVLAFEAYGMDTCVIDQNGIAFISPDDPEAEPVPSGLGSKDLEQISYLGAGQFGNVFKVRHNTTKELFALKEIRVPYNEEERKSLIREITVLHHCQSPFVVSFNGCYYADDTLCLCMEYMDAGSIETLLSKGGPFPEAAITKMAIAVTTGLHYMKSEHRALHRDIKPDNMLVNRKGEIKICDFGISNIAEGSVVFTRCGTPAYKAPERVDPHCPSYGSKADIWSLAVSLLEVALGHHPLAEEKPPGSGNWALGMHFQVSNQIMSKPLGPMMPASFDADLVDYVKQGLVQNAGQRCSLNDMMQHPFMTKNAGKDIDIASWVCSLHDNKPQAASSAPAGVTPAARGIAVANLTEAPGTSEPEPAPRTTPTFVTLREVSVRNFTGLQAHSLVQSDPSPYLVVKVGQREVLQTSKVNRSKTPKWKLDKGNLPPLEPSDAVTLELWDHHNLHKNVLLCSCSAEVTLFDKGGEPLELTLHGSVNGRAVSADVIASYVAQIQ